MILLFSFITYYEDVSIVRLAIIITSYSDRVRPFFASGDRTLPNPLHHTKNHEIDLRLAEIKSNFAVQLEDVDCSIQLSTTRLPVGRRYPRTGVCTIHSGARTTN